MTTPTGPDLSVVLCTPDHWDRVRKVLRFLRAQTVRDRIEIVLVSPRADELDIVEGDLEGFHSVRWVDHGPFSSCGGPRAAGAMAAGSAVVAFAEDHSFPSPRWAETTIAAHARGCSAVGAAMANANDDTALSRADFVLNFGSNVAPVHPGASYDLPWHNTAYDAGFLRSRGASLARELESELLLLRDLERLGRRGFRIDAATRHVNASRTSYFLKMQLWGAWQAWALLALHEGWSVARRLVVAAGTPALPALRSARAIRDLRRLEPSPVRRLATLPAILLGSLVLAIGTAAGLLGGPAGAGRRRLALEFSRTRVRPGEVGVFFALDDA